MGYSQNDFEVIEELTFAEYLIHNLKVLTYDEFNSDMFRYFFYESYYSGYKRYCKKNHIYAEKVYFNTRYC